jgi:hypothetical protein
VKIWPSGTKFGQLIEQVRHHLTSEFEPLVTFPHDSEATAPKEAFVMQLAAVEGCKTRQPSTRLYINKISATHSPAVRISDMCFHSVGDSLTGSCMFRKNVQTNISSLLIDQLFGNGLA